MPKRLLEIAADIVQTQASKNQLSSEEVVSSLKQIFGALQELETQRTSVETVKEPEPAPDKMDPKDSIQADKIVCLECGAEMRQLTARHVQGHGLTVHDYRRKYNLPLKQPLSAKSLTKQRSKMAKKRGLPENLRKYIEAKRQVKIEGAAPSGEAKETPPARRTEKKA